MTYGKGPGPSGARDRLLHSHARIHALTTMPNRINGTAGSVTSRLVAMATPSHVSIAAPMDRHGEPTARSAGTQTNGLTVIPVAVRKILVRHRVPDGWIDRHATSPTRITVRRRSRRDKSATTFSEPISPNFMS